MRYWRIRLAFVGLFAAMARGLAPISANLITFYEIHLNPPLTRRFRQDLSELRPIGYNFMNWNKWNDCLVEYSHDKFKFAPLTMVATL